MIDLTKSQCDNLAEFIECHIFDAIRDEPDIDNIAWLIDMVDAYKKLKEVADE